jgi:hypothetical protein
MYVKSRPFQTLLTLATLTAAASTVAQPRVELRPTSSSIDVMVDGRLFTSYVHQTNPAKPMAAQGILLAKPVLFPLRTPSGITVTRGWPFEAVKGERQDYQMPAQARIHACSPSHQAA